MTAILLAFAMQGLTFAQSTSYRQSFPLPGNTVPDGLGVDIHFISPPPKEIARIAEAGFKWVRMDMYWIVVEQHRGHYDFSQYDRLMEELDRHHIRPIFILDSIQDGFGPVPSDPNVLKGFCNFVQAAVTRYRHRGIVWELFNEPNLDDYWKPHANVQEYVEYGKAVGNIIRQSAPDEWFIGPALSHWDWPFLEGCCRGGLLSYWDGVSVHPYRNEEPETVISDWRHLAETLLTYAPAGKSIAMISGEWGYSDLTTGAERQAQYAARMYLVNLMSGVGLTIWYDWKNDAGNGESRQRHFGIVGEDYSPKPAGNYLKTLTNRLNGFRFVKRLPTASDEYLLFFVKGNARKVVGWTTAAEDRELQLQGAISEQQLGEAERVLTGKSPTVELTGTPTLFDIG